jgi:hypothetical protein
MYTVNRLGAESLWPLLVVMVGERESCTVTKLSLKFDERVGWG